MYTDAELQKRVAEGDETAFRLLFDRHYDAVFRYSLSIAKIPELAEEIISDVFLKLWLGRTALTGIAHLEAFLIRMTRNKTIDFLRQASRHRRIQQLLAAEVGSLQDPVETADARELQQTIAEVLALLNPMRRRIFELHRQGGLTHKQIARQLNISPNTVRNNISAALRSIRGHLRAGLFSGPLLICLLRQ